MEIIESQTEDVILVNYIEKINIIADCFLREDSKPITNKASPTKKTQKEQIAKLTKIKENKLFW